MCSAGNTKCLEKLAPLIHQLECQYLVEKLTSAVVIVKIYVRVLMFEVSGCSRDPKIPSGLSICYSELPEIAANPWDPS